MERLFLVYQPFLPPVSIEILLSLWQPLFRPPAHFPGIILTKSGKTCHIHLGCSFLDSGGLFQLGAVVGIQSHLSDLHARIKAEFGFIQGA